MNKILNVAARFLLLITLFANVSYAEMTESVGVIDELTLSEGLIMVSDQIYKVTNFTVIQRQGDDDSMRRPQSLLKLGQEVKITYDYEYNRYNTIETLIILSN